MNLIEAVAVVSGALYVLLAGRNMFSSWWLGLINIFCYTYIFYLNRLYADVLLQFFYFLATIYGMYIWKGRCKNISYLSFKEVIISILFSVLLSIGIYILNSNIHIWYPTIFKFKADFPIIDSFIAGFSIVATILIANKKIDSWIWFVIIDIVASIVYNNKELYLTSTLFILYAFLAFLSIKQWKKTQTNAS